MRSKKEHGYIFKKIEAQNIAPETCFKCGNKYIPTLESLTRCIFCKNKKLQNLGGEVIFRKDLE